MNSWSINIIPVLSMELKIATKRNLPFELEGAPVLPCWVLSAAKRVTFQQNDEIT
jgi:hypothetical protein